MEHSELRQLRKDAPLLIRAYELRKRTVHVQLLLLDERRKTDVEDTAMLSKWISNNQEWLTKTEQKYFQALKLVRFTEEELINLNTGT